MSEKELHDYLAKNMAIHFSFDDDLPTLDIYLEDEVICYEHIPLNNILKFISNCIHDY